MIPEYKIREKKTFANYRGTALKLRKSYSDFEFLMTMLVKEELTKETLAKKVDYAEYIEKLKPIAEDAEAVEKLNLEYSDKLVTIFNLMLKLNEDIRFSKELWLSDEEFKNAKKLVEIYYEDCTFEFGEFEDEQYNEVIEWLMGVLDFFLTKPKPLTVWQANVKRLRNTIKSQTNPI